MPLLLGDEFPPLTECGAFLSVVGAERGIQDRIQLGHLGCRRLTIIFRDDVGVKVSRELPT